MAKKASGDVEEAYAASIRDLRRCYCEEGILAGLIRFDDYWARDSFFASLGCCVLGDFDIVKKNLLLFLKHQKENGQLPRRIDRYYVGLKYLGMKIKRDKPKPRYTTSLGYCYSVDQNSLFIISLSEYMRKTKDKPFLKDVYNKAKKAIDWNFMNTAKDDVLIKEGFFANWEDTIIWRGRLLYTNLLHQKALSDFADLSAIVDENEDHERYSGLAGRVKEKINSDYWSDDHYMKSTRLGDRYKKYFCIDANLLAIMFDVADKERSEKIISKIQGLGLDNEAPMRSTWPRYPLWKVSPARLLIFSAGYHDAFGWLWVSSLYAAALQKLGMKKEAKEYLGRMADKINEFDGVYEVYSNGKPMKSIFVKSDYPFAWSAGMMVHTYNKLMKKHINR